MTSDPRLTAYANGALDPAEREIFERELAASPELQTALNATIHLCDHLMKTLPDPADTLTAAQRESLRAARSETILAAAPTHPRRRPAVLGALAAGLALALGLWALHGPVSPETPPAALASAPPAKAPVPSPAATPGNPSASEGLVTKEFKISPKFLASLAPTASGESAAKPRLKEILTAHGMTFPPGTSANYLPLSAKLVIRNTPANLDLMDGLDLVQSPANPNATVLQKLAEADVFYTRGSYDLAFKRTEEVLALDKFNVPARRIQERVANARAQSAEFATNETRGRSLLTADISMSYPVTRYANKDKAGETSVGGTNGVAAPVGKSRALSADGASGQLQDLEAGSLTPTTLERPAVIGFAQATQSPQGGAAPSLSDARVHSQALSKIDMLQRGSDSTTASLAPSAVGGYVAARDGVPMFGAPAPNSGPFFGQLKEPNDETYAAVTGNVFQAAGLVPLSTFSIDVDTASYANVRRFLNDGQLPPPDAVRLEELINYFPSALPPPTADGDAPFSITTVVTRAPWDEHHLLARIALKGREMAADKLPASNLVFLVDVSGSMRPENKLPLLKRALGGLVERLRPEDRVAIVVYAGNSGLALPSTSGAEQVRLLAAIDGLESGGSTNGAEGIQLAYQTAREHFLKEGNNRVILCTDGDFNVGVTSPAALTRLIERERKSGVFLSVLGFGTGNVKDATMERLADKGNGNYAYIDSPAEARKVLVEQMGGTLFTIAKDVKIQVEFNPATVAGYRLLGYENRLLAKEDFNDDTKDAGEIGAGHTVTALYEIVPAGQPLPNDRTVDPLKYQAPAEESGNPKSKIQNPKSPDLFTVKLRYKAPNSDTSRLLEKVVGPAVMPFAEAGADVRFASAVAAFGMKLRGDRADAAMDWDAIQQIARAALGEDRGAYRAEFLTLVEKAKHVAKPEDER